jgi:hypothetical protein
MSKIDDGGAAFPGMASDGHRDYRPGLTKRDYFAAAALPAVISMALQGNITSKDGAAITEKMIAEQTLLFADALIAASKTGGPEHG